MEGHTAENRAGERRGGREVVSTSCDFYTAVARARSWRVARVNNGRPKLWDDASRYGAATRMSSSILCPVTGMGTWKGLAGMLQECCANGIC